MVRTMGYVVGLLALLDGLIGSFQPRLGFRIWEERVRPHCPESINKVTDEYARLSDPAIRIIGYWEVLLAGLVLVLARKARD